MHGVNMQTQTESEMADKERTNMPIRIAIDALKSAKIAASLKEMSVADYVSNLVREAANADIAAWHRAQSSKTKRGGA
jgi:hypothetical protein